jgi:hypothetical protein
MVAKQLSAYINTNTKKKRLAALRRKHYGEGSGGRSSGGRPEGRPDDFQPPRPNY